MGMGRERVEDISRARGGQSRGHKQGQGAPGIIYPMNVGCLGWFVLTVERKGRILSRDEARTGLSSRMIPSGRQPHGRCIGGKILTSGSPDQ